MSLSNSVIRRYTPPTCTLEIWAENSPLSNWADKNIIKNLQFRLQFDDPRLSEDRKIMIQGDQQQLQFLCNIITTYVQELLQQSAEDFSINLLDTNNSPTPSEREAQDTPTTVLPNPIISPAPNPFSSAKVYLEPSSNLTHELHLGYLANQTSGQVIELTLLQLFDLATALDEYSSDMLALPTPSYDAAPTSLPRWAPIAAILVIAAGLTPFTWQYATNFQQNRSQVAQKTSPSVPKDNLPPSSTVNLATPQSTLTPPLANLSTPSSSLAFPNPILSVSPTSPQAAAITPNASTYPITPQFSLPPIVPKIDTSSVTQTRRNSPRIIPENPINAATSQKLPTNNNNTSPSIYTDNHSITTIPKNLISNNTDTQSAISNTELQQAQAESPQLSPQEKKDNLVRRLRSATKSSSSTPVNNKTLFDTPQIAEAREYLNKRWQPPTGLSQALEYSLMLGADGTIERILPLNQAAREYIDTSGLPQIGKPFVSTNQSGQNLRIRVVLNPDGKVQTFLETP
ncbi:MAG: DUF4335 domain-containing protein [Cuspidothrix sp.]|jgi:hypothetical protein